MTERERQINKCQAIVKALNGELGEERFTYHYDVCESGLTTFSFILKDGTEIVTIEVRNDFLDSEESKDLSIYAPKREQKIMWSMQGLL